MPTLSSNSNTTWDKNKVKSVSFDWADKRNPGTGKVSVKLGDAARSYDVPQTSVAVDNQAGSLTNNTTKTISYTLS
ncbi:MAG TPA: hypothetical protein VGX92_07600 [Pyrinomonadaceae bacterium]|nr:hypothetical protein [Pyrinomonadaceae bacterium]